MIRAVIRLTIVNPKRSRTNLQKVGVPPGLPQLETFFLESSVYSVLSLSLFTFHSEGGQKATLISLSIYMVYYYISYTIRNIIKLIKRRDIDKREKEKETRFYVASLPGLLSGLLRKLSQKAT